MFLACVLATRGWSYAAVDGVLAGGHGRGQRDASNGASAPWSGDGEQLKPH
jgi:hypothetical protein